MVKGIVKGFSAKSGKPNGKINIIPGWIEPSDMREIKRLAALMGVDITLFPDTSGVVDSPQTGHYNMFPAGGTTIPELIATGDSQYTIALGNLTSEDGAKELENRCGVKYSVYDLPIGISATDRFISALSDISGKPVPAVITEERGRLVDMITDMQQYLYHKRVALWGDPDQLFSLSEFLVALDMKPVYVVSGTPGKLFDVKMSEILSGVPEAQFKNGSGADMFLMHQWIKNEKVDLLMGNTYGKYIARDEDIPFVRVGFPIMDRVGHSYFPTVGYAGAMRLVEKMLGALMDYQDSHCPENAVELQM